MENITNTVPFFTLKGLKTEAKVVHVYDGDTIHVVFNLFDKYYKWVGRIAHVDTPELRTKNENEKKLGYHVRDKLREMILNKIVTIECLEFDKYGRLLIEIYLEGLYINQWLIDNNFAKKYDGGTKQSWDL